MKPNRRQGPLRGYWALNHPQTDPQSVPMVWEGQGKGFAIFLAP
jgi:hypothetical protein